MRVAVVNRTARRAGGVETYLGRVVPELRRLGHDVFFWHERHEPLDRDLIAGVANVPSCCVAAVGGPAALHTLADWQPDVLYVHHVESPDLERELQAIAAGVFFAHDYYGTCISGTKTVRLPVLHPCEREFGPMCLVQYFPRRCGGLSPVTMIRDYRRQSARLDLLRRYDAIATFSEHMRNEYLRHGFERGRLHRLPPVDPMQADPVTDDGRRLRMLSPESDPHAQISRLVFIGRIDRLKGCEVMLQALPEVRAAIGGRILLTVAGDGADLPRCRESAARITATLADIDVVFLGWAPPQTCADLLETADVLVMPSLWPEPFGLAGIEAQRRGVPVAAFAVGGIPEWLDDGKTGAVAPGNPPSAAGLAKAIVRCLTSVEIRQTVRARAVEGAWDYSIGRHTHSLVPLLAAAAANARLGVENTMGRHAETVTP